MDNLGLVGEKKVSQVWDRLNLASRGDQWMSSTTLNEPTE
jgi:hypothetical protein